MAEKTHFEMEIFEMETPTMNISSSEVIIIKAFFCQIKLMFYFVDNYFY